MDSNVSLNVEGMEDVISSFKTLARKYPDKAGELLQKNAKELRKEVIHNVKQDTTVDSDNKKSLARAGSYKISQIKGFNEHQYVEISAKAPHFHLVEHGHEIIMPRFHGIKGQKGVHIPNKNAGQKVGFVQGKHMMAKAVRKIEEDMPDTLESMVDELLKEGGFK